MAVDREVMPDSDLPAPERPPGRAALGRAPTRVSTAIIIWYAVVAILLAGWFFFGWLVLRQGFVDSAGESIGAGFALLLIVSIVGTVRRSRR
jgi:hypothetical protein